MGFNKSSMERIVLVACAIDACLHKVSEVIPDWARFELCNAVSDLLQGGAPDPAYARDPNLITDHLEGFKLAHNKKAKLFYNANHDPNDICDRNGCGHAYSQHFDSTDNYMPGCLVTDCPCKFFINKP